MKEVTRVKMAKFRHNPSLTNSQDYEKEQQEKESERGNAGWYDDHRQVE